MQYHEYANAFPMMSPFEMTDLVESIKENGLRNAIMVYDGKILDGRNRFEACRKAGVNPHFETFEGTPEEAFKYVKDSNLTRRNMSEEQRGFTVAKLAKLKPGNPELIARGEFSANRANLGSDKTISELAKEIKVNPAMARRARAVLANGISTLEPAVVEGKVTMSAAEQIAKLSPQNQSRAIIEGWTADRAKACRAREEVNVAKKPASLVTRDEVAEPIAIEGLDKMKNAVEDARAAMIDALRLARAARNYRGICGEIDSKWNNEIRPLIEKIGLLL